MNTMQFLGIKWKKDIPYIVLYDDLTKSIIYERCLRKN